MHHYFKKISVFVVSILFCLSISSASAKEIKPYWDIQDPDLEMHLKSLVYMRDIIRIEEADNTEDRVNFIFLSSPDYIKEEVLNSKKIKDTLGLKNTDFLDKYTDTDGSCLILTFENFGGRPMTLGVNGTKDAAQATDFKCLLVTLFKFEGITVPIGDTSSVKKSTIDLINTYIGGKAND